MSFIVLFIISIWTSSLFFRIGKGWLSFIPLFFLLLYSGDYIGQFSFKKVWKKVTNRHWALLSWLCIMVGIILLWKTEWILRYYTTGALVTINNIFLLLSYHTNYEDGKTTFSQWTIISRLLLISIGIYNRIELNTILIIMNIASIELFLVREMVWRYCEKNKENEKDILLNKEIWGYITIYFLSFLIFWFSLISSVLQIWYSTFLIALRQHFLSYQSKLIHEKEEWLTGRALLQGQKILKRYEDKKDQTYSIMNTFLEYWIVPSHKWLQFLQIAQGIQMMFLIGISIYKLRNWIEDVLIWYWLWVLCFIINLFWLDRQDKLFSRYKKLSLIITSGALYITVFSQSTSQTTIVVWSLIRNTSNMFLCLFYDTLIPENKRILTRGDLLFRMLRTNLTVIISIFTLFQLSLSWDALFALSCIIIWGTGYFSYHIWKKYSIL